MLTFTDTPVTKSQLVNALEAHQKADRIVQGHYWKGNGEGSGCAVGCSLHDFGENTSDHSAYERLFGIPRILARLENGIFEGLAVEDAKAWPLRFANAVPEGKDLSLIWPKFAVWLLADAEHGIIRFAKTERSKKATQAVADAYARVAAGGEIKSEDWRGMRAAAYAVDAYADVAAAAAYAVYSVDAYASASLAAAYAVYSVDAYAQIKTRKAQADKLIELLEAA